MDVVQLKEKLVGDIEKITYLLEEAGFTNIYQSSSKNLRGNFDDGNNNTSVNIETLSSSCFSRNINGDIFTLLGAKLNLEFYETYQWVCKKLGYSSKYREKTVRLPFSGVWRKFSKAETYDNDDYDTYTDEELLGDRKISGNHLFLKDGISLPVQEEFLCHYDIESNRFGIVWKDQFGRNIGCMGRYNGDYEADKVSKWHPIGKGGFNKSNHLFGLNYNRDKIIEKDAIFIGESEKFVLQLASWDMRTGVALGGNQLSQTRINLIHGLRVKRIFICLDEGLEESHSKKLAESLKCNTSFYSNEVYYVFDKDNKYLPKDSKMSPSDLDYEDFKKLIKECSILV